MISFRQFRYFVEIVEAGSYSRAAETLYVAQSALSRQIKELEAEVQTPLLLRDARHVETTEAGRLFYERAKRLLGDVEETIRQTRQIGSGAQGVIRLLHSSSVTITPALGQVLADLLRRFPYLTLDVSKAASENQATDIEEGRADIGLVRLPVLGKYPGLAIRDLFSEKLMVAVSAQSPLAAGSALGLADLREEKFVSLPHRHRGGLSYLVAGLCEAHGYFPTAARALSRKTSQLNLIEAGLGIAIVPESMRTVAPPGVCFIPLIDAHCDSTVALVWRRAASPLVAGFAEALMNKIEDNGKKERSIPE